MSNEFEIYLDSQGVPHHTAEGAARVNVILAAKSAIVTAIAECGKDGIHADRRIGAGENAAAMITLYRQRAKLNDAFDGLDLLIDRFLSVGGELRTIHGFENWRPPEAPCAAA